MNQHRLVQWADRCAESFTQAELSRVMRGGEPRRKALEAYHTAIATLHALPRRSAARREAAAETVRAWRRWMEIDRPLSSLTA